MHFPSFQNNDIVATHIDTLIPPTPPPSPIPAKRCDTNHFKSEVTGLGDRSREFGVRFRWKRARAGLAGAQTLNTGTGESRMTP
jgi:hypothetical protein